MIYLDTGCLVKLNYPEPDSAKIAARVAGRPIWFTPLHDLEFTNALTQKAFRGQASPLQINAALSLIQVDLAAGTLVPASCDWTQAYRSAAKLSLAHTPSIGCRSLDILHCALASDLHTSEFISTDAKQCRLALSIGLPWSPI